MTEEKITFEQAKTWGKDHKDIMAPADSIDSGRVADLSAAEELAISEQKTRDLESALRREAASGYTEEQLKMLERIAVIKEKYPDALVEEINGDLRMWFVDVKDAREQFVFTLDGVFKVWLKTEGSLGKINNKTLNLDVLSGQIKSILSTDHEDYWNTPSLIINEAYQQKFYANSDYIIVHEVDLTNTDDGSRLQGALETASDQKEQAKAKKEAEQKVLENL